MTTATNSAVSTAEQLKSKASEAASSMTDKAKQAAATVGNKAEDATHAVGSGMKSLADTIRDRGPREGALGSATSSLASGLESSGRYLQQHNISGIAEDLTELMRRNPVPVLLMGVGFGFLLARALVRR